MEGEPQAFARLEAILVNSVAFAFRRFRVAYSGVAPVHHFVESSPCPMPRKPAPNGQGSFRVLTKWRILSGVMAGEPPL